MGKEDAKEIRKIITQLYSFVSDDFKPEIAHDFEDPDCEADITKSLHALFEYKCLNKLPSGMIGQDSGQPWFLYWLTNGLEVCNQSNFTLTNDLKAKCVSYLRQCHNVKEGGFSGAPGLQSHLASTYAAVLAIVNIGTEEAYKIIDIPKMKEYLLNMKNNTGLKLEQAHPSNSWVFKDKESGEVYNYKGASHVLGTLPGAMAIHENGEMDMRGAYCGLVVADILNILEGNPDLTQGIGDFISTCQTYEGGISCAPYGEAHGGYTFCGLAAMLLLGEEDKVDLNRCLEWLTQRQISEEGGFNGRINKLVDSCYNFWQGATFELLDIAMKGKCNVDGEWLYNQYGLQAYTIYCCQQQGGGLKDKPGKYPDPYHTAYSLSGCSIAQHKSDYENLHAKTEHAQKFASEFNGNYGDHPSSKDLTDKERDELEFSKTALLGGVLNNKLRRMHPVYNTRYDLVMKARNYYRENKS